MNRADLNFKEEFHIWTLPNGIRCIHRPVASHVSHIGLFINAGSRDELPHEHGMAHFIEHVFFKGTGRRKSFHILSRMDDVGGELNAYTSKEETVVHATFLNEHYSRALDLVSDIVFNASFPAKELEKEKTVILDEMNSYLDSPSDVAFDEFDALVFKDHPMGRTVLGTPDSLASFKPEGVRSFVDRNYHTDQMVFASVGSIRPEALRKMVDRYFGHIAARHRDWKRQPSTVGKGLSLTRQLDISQDHVLLGGTAYAADHDDRLGLLLLVDLLGGSGMNSRLNLLLRERHGYTYGVDASYASFSDCGLYSIYYSSDHRHTDRCLNMVNRELRRVREQRLGIAQLQRAKQQMLGQIAISQEHNQSQMLGLGRSFLMFDRVQTWDEVMRRIDGLTADELLRIANEVFDPAGTDTVILTSKS